MIVSGVCKFSHIYKKSFKVKLVVSLNNHIIYSFTGDICSIIRFCQKSFTNYVQLSRFSSVNNMYSCFITVNAHSFYWHINKIECIAKTSWKNIPLNDITFYILQCTQFLKM